MNGGAYRRARIALSAAALLISILTFVFAGSALAGFASLQFGPALLAVSAGLSVLGMTVMVGTLVLTLFFGRVFCAVLYPLGALQEGIGVLFRNKAGVVPNAKTLRYGIAFLAFAGLAGGWGIGFRLLDPFSRFGAVVFSGISVTGGTITYAVIGGLLSLFAIGVPVYCKRRIFCTAVCPVGTLFGLLSCHSLYRIRMGEGCASCGRCQRECPTGCIDAASRTIDNERCVLCLNCLSLCTTGGIGYSQMWFGAKPVNTATVDGARRAFLAKGVAAAVGVAAAGCGLRSAIGADAVAGEAGGGILPPGAGDAARFDRLCTSCQLCASSCPTRIIRPTWWGFGPVRLNFDAGRCDYECARCSAACPTGALRRLSLADKQWLRIGEATLDEALCRIAADGEPCDLCARACPTGAIYQPVPQHLPEVNAYHCIGCGACQSVCPTTPKAVTVGAIDSQQAI